MSSVQGKDPPEGQQTLPAAAPHAPPGAATLLHPPVGGDGVGGGAELARHAFQAFIIRVNWPLVKLFMHESGTYDM